MNANTTLTWHSVRIDWPCEKVVAEVKVIAPRELDVFEWAVARILEEFQDQTPSLQESSERLGLRDPVFLKTTLDNLIELKAVQLRDPAGASELPNCQLTAIGRELLTKGRVTGLSERHGLHLLFDVITTEHLIRMPRNICKTPENPIFVTDELPARMTHLGLDRVRELAQRQNEPFHQGESRICEVAVDPQQGEYVWFPVYLGLSISAQGGIEARLQDSSKTRQEWIDRNGWSSRLLSDMRSASTAGWANGRCQHRESPAVFADWFKQTLRLVPPASTVSEARRLVDAARKEVVLHTGWLDAPGIENALTEAASRGVRCYVCGSVCSLTAWSIVPTGTPGFVAAGGSSVQIRPLALIADHTQGLCIDRLCLKTPAGQEFGVEVTAVTSPAAISQLRQRLLAGVAEELTDDDVQHLFAAFALTQDVVLWQRGLRQIESRPAGVEQIKALRQWAEWAQQIAPDSEAADGWFTPTIEHWRTALRSAEQNHEDYTELLDAVVGLMAPADVLVQLLSSVSSSQADQDSVALSDLLMRAGAVRYRWPDFHPVYQCPRFAALARSCLPSDSAGGTAQLVQDVTETLMKNVRFQSEGRTWLSILSAAIAGPSDIPSFIDWLEAHAPLVSHLGASFQRAAEQHLERIRHLLRDLTTNNPLVEQLLRIWTDLGLPTQAFAKHKSVTSPGVAKPFKQETGMR